jgi:hypothetical protein
VTLLQFGSNGVIDGYAGPVDLDAYRGTLAQLAASGLFKDWSAVTTPAQIATAVHAYGYVNPVTKVNQSFETRVFEIALPIASTPADGARPSVKTMLATLQTELDAVKAVVGNATDVPALIVHGDATHLNSLDAIAATLAGIAATLAEIKATLSSAIADLDTRLTNLETKVEDIPAGPAGPPGVVDLAAVETVLSGAHAEVTFATPAAAS